MFSIRPLVAGRLPDWVPALRRARWVGPYSGTSSLAAFLRVGAVTAGLTYGIVVNGFTGLFGRSSGEEVSERGGRGRAIDG